MSTLGRCLRSLGITVGLLLCVGIATPPASAATIIYNFTGDVTNVNALLNPPFAVNLSPTAMSGTMTVDTFDNNAPDIHVGSYKITSFSMNIEGNTYTQGPPAFFGVEIHSGLPGQDQFNVTVPLPAGLGFPSPPSPVALTPDELFINLHAPGGTGPFSNDSLPTAVPSLCSFALKNEWRLNFAPGGHQVSGTITTLTAVPLPPAVLLFGAGLVALMGLGARNWQRAQA